MPSLSDLHDGWLAIGFELALQRMAKNEGRDLRALQPVVFVGGEAERPFGQACLAQGVDDKSQILGVAKMRIIDPPRS